MKRHLVVIGGTAAGMSAAARARRGDPSLPITVFERSGHITYSCGLPYYIGDEIKDIHDLIVYKPEYEKERNIDVNILHEVTEINIQKICRRKGPYQGKHSNSYIVISIATGAAPVIPPIPGADNKNVSL